MKCKISDDIKKDIKKILIKIDKLVEMTCRNTYLLKRILDHTNTSKTTLKSAVFYNGQKFRIFFKKDTNKHESSIFKTKTRKD